MLTSPVSAFAAGGTLLGYYPAGSDTSTSRNIGAVAYLGGDWFSLSDAQRSVLAGSTSGGGSGTDSSPNFPSYAFFRDTVNYVSVSFAGSTDTEYSSSLEGFGFADAVDKARKDWSRFLTWEPPTSPSAPPSGGGLSFTLSANQRTYFYLDNSGPFYCNYPDGKYVVVSSAVLTFSGSGAAAYNSAVADGYGLLYAATNDGGGAIVLSTAHLTPVYSTMTTSQGLTINWVSSFKNDTGGAVSLRVISLGEYSRTVSGSVLNANYASGTSSSRSVANGASYNIKNGSAGYMLLGSGGGFGGGGGGGAFGPDEPSVPDPWPEPLPDIDWPDLGPITYPTQPTSDTPAAPASPDLDPIYRILVQIRDFVEVWSNSWRNAFATMADNLAEMLDTISRKITLWARTINDSIWNHYLSLRGDLYDWLKEIDGDVNGFRASVETWLQMIYTRLGVIDSDIGELSDVYQPTVDTGNTVSTQLSSDMDKVKRKFPFSIPWDVYAFLKLIEAPPRTPVITFWWPYTDGLVVDFSPLDGVAGISRTFTLFVFTGGLILKTKDFLSD